MLLMQCLCLMGHQRNKLEVKLDLKADYGQGTLDYIDGVWRLGGANTVEAVVLRELMFLCGNRTICKF